MVVLWGAVVVSARPVPVVRCAAVEVLAAPPRPVVRCAAVELVVPRPVVRWPAVELVVPRPVVRWPAVELVVSRPVVRWPAVDVLPRAVVRCAAVELVLARAVVRWPAVEVVLLGVVVRCAAVALVVSRPVVLCVVVEVVLPRVDPVIVVGATRVVPGGVMVVSPSSLVEGIVDEEPVLSGVVRGVAVVEVCVDVGGLVGGNVVRGAAVVVAPGELVVRTAAVDVVRSLLSVVR